MCATEETGIKALNGWWRFVVGLLIGTIVPSLLAWGSMSTKIEHNTQRIKEKVGIKEFNEYKDGNNKLLGNIYSSLERIETKIDNKMKDN